jgi:hypothetical protein
MVQDNAVTGRDRAGFQKRMRAADVGMHIAGAYKAGPSSRRWTGLLALALIATTMLGWPSPAEAATSDQIRITSLSTRADTVTGDDVLVRVELAAHLSPDAVVVRLNGRDVTSSFRVVDHGLTGLVTGLRLGRNTLTAYTRSRSRAGDRITLRDFPKEGPVFSGPHEQPFVCETESFTLPVIGGDLGPALDANCSIATRVDYFYRTTGGTFAAGPRGATQYPPDRARTTTTRGQTVPYIVRMETGTINRAIYEMTILHDPIAEPAPSFQARPKGWNGRLIYTFGGGCIGGWYRQGATTGGVDDDFMLRNGYAVASSSLNVFGNNCQDVTAAETMMMVKERFIEAYGPDTHTQGFGCSGGSYQQHQIADNYPGLLDGILPGCSFPEVGFGTINFITDAWLIDNYFTSLANVDWSPEQKRRVTGFAVYATAPNVAVGARRIDPRVFCGVVPQEQRYNPVTNPGGVRCDVYDHTVNVYGRDPNTGFARRPLDNVGIQYGLRPLNEGAITKAQFLDLNERIGGFDADANIIPQRTVADLAATRRAYRTGRLTNGGGGLASTPIIDYRAYNDDVPQGDIHVRYHSFSMRERLIKANGRADNQVMLVEDNRYGLYSTQSPLLQHAILKLDQWITAINADTRAGHRIDKIVRNKPADLREGCNTREPNPRFIAQRQVRDPSTLCEQLYPSESFPREVAGANIAADIIKCQLKPIDPSDYTVRFTESEQARFQRIFPQGVCDWSRRGVAQQGLAGTWLSFGAV